MTKHNEIKRYEIAIDHGTVDPQQWITEGQTMARTDPTGVLETIEIKRSAEDASHDALVKQIDARGFALHAHWTAIKNNLEEMRFDLANHLHQTAQGNLDLALAVALLAIGAILTAFVLFAYAPLWLTVFLGFLVLASAFAVEEFFDAHKEKATLREGVFLTLALMALGAQLWLGTLRGILLGALAPATSGPATQAMGIGASILRYTLGAFSLVAEVVAGFKLWRARERLLAPIAQAVRERDRCERELFALRVAMERAKAEPAIRHHYRAIGARQELAWRSGAGERSQASHLRRAFKGAIIALLIVAVLLLLAGRAGAAPVVPQNKAILLDLTLSETPADLKANIDEISAILGELHAADRIVVLGIAAEFGRPLILLDETLPRDAGHYGLQEQAGRETIIAKWKELSRDLKPTFPATDIIGALGTLNYIGGFEPAGAHICILSDMQQATRDLDLENVEVIPIAPIITKLKQANGIPALRGAQVFVLGADPLGKSRTYFSSLREFWFQFFREAGAELKTFDIGRRFPNF